MSLDSLSYRIGKRTIDRLVKSLEEFTADNPLASISPYLVGRDCSGIRQAVLLYFTYHSIRWVYEPRGPSPATKAEIVARALCSEGVPIDTELLEELSAEAGTPPSEGAEE